MDREELMKRLEGIGDKDFCRRLNVIDRHGYVTYAGLMMFGKAPEIFEYIPTFCVDYVEIPGSSIERSNVRFADLCENVGFGIDRIYDWKTLTGKEVTIESMKDRTVVTLMMVPVTDDVRRSDTGQMEKLGEKLGRRLNGNQAKIIGMMIENPYVSIPELSVRVGISTTAVENNISLFKSKGLIRRVGPDKGGHWEVEI